MKKGIDCQFAGRGYGCNATWSPEINPAVIPTAVALLGGGILVVRAYLKK